MLEIIQHTKMNSLELFLIEVFLINRHQAHSLYRTNEKNLILAFQLHAEFYRRYDLFIKICLKYPFRCTHGKDTQVKIIIHHGNVILKNHVIIKLG